MFSDKQYEINYCIFALMKNLSEILIWKQSFGLLPIHLEPTNNESKFVMLNGGYGDFCLQTIADGSRLEDYYSKSWSSNTKNFVVIDGDKVKVFNWERNKSEEVTQKQVSDNLSKFYNYLLSKSYKSERDIVPFILDIFKQFRNITLEKTNPTDALNLLFILLTSIEDDYANFDSVKWNVNEIKIPDGFAFFVDSIKTGVNSIKPQLELILRHSAGILFQEAQKEVLFFNPQRDLFGGISNIIKTSKGLYSSIHYTPPYIARTIVENSIRRINLEKRKIKIFDPACGSSEFLIEALKQLKESNYQGFVEVIGWDSSETAINTSKFLLKYEQRTVWGNNLDFKIRLVDDSLTENWDNDYDLILMNPPFISWELLSNKNSKVAVKDTLASTFMGKPNQASAFFYKSVNCLLDGGIIGCVIPTSLLTLDAYKKLRSTISEIMTIELIGKLGNFIFEDALTDASFIIGTKGKTNHIPTILWTRNEKGIAQNALRDLRKMFYSNNSTVDEKDYSIYHPITFPIIRESWKPISLRGNDLLKTTVRFVAEKKLIEVGEIFNVKQGIRQGIKDIFKISKDDFKKLPGDEKKYFRPVIDNESIKNGEISKNNFLWYPYNENGMVFKSETSLRKNANHFYSSILKPNKKDLENRSGITEWWGLTRLRNWQFVQERKLVSTEFGHSGSFAIDEKGVFVVERGNAWIPKNKFLRDDYYFYLSIFSSSQFDKLLSVYSKQLAGGQWYDLGKMYTTQIPIPNVHSEKVRASEAYYKLVEIGKELTLGNSYVRPISDEILSKYFYPEA